MEAFRAFRKQMHATLETGLEMLHNAIAVDRRKLINKIESLEAIVASRDRDHTFIIQQHEHFLAENVALQDAVKEKDRSILLLVALLNDRETIQTTTGSHKVGHERRKRLEAHLKAERIRLFSMSGSNGNLDKEIREAAGEA